ncbi:MAG: hypothetical protein S4CHLAM45_00370 [Chlamydiales bacterium]|nr:hypothetical protein [Chlamydiales bacterium]MCH9619361.1 hypothetical protein [Chlamydiales bacterium]MCH9622165.1 hypothetical protein [Chlamydiales bacterium]
MSSICVVLGIENVLTFNLSQLYTEEQNDLTEKGFVVETDDKRYFISPGRMYC